MKANTWLSILYYDISKQMCEDLRTSFSIKYRNGDVVYYKWRKILDVVGADIEFSHRTILINEIVIDIETREYSLLYLMNKCNETKLRYYIIDTTSKGYHIHMFDDKMFFMKKRQREEYREKYCEWFNVTYDKQLLKENHMISFEFTPHWKTSEIPILLATNMKELKGDKK